MDLTFCGMGQQKVWHDFESNVELVEFIFTDEVHSEVIRICNMNLNLLEKSRGLLSYVHRKDPILFCVNYIALCILYCNVVWTRPAIANVSSNML